MSLPHSPALKASLTPRPESPWPMREAAAYLGVSERHLYRLANRGKLATIQIGRRRLIADAEVQRLARRGC